MSTAAQLREEAYASAIDLTQSLQLPPGCALAATGSFARRAMAPFSDLDLILLHPDDMELPEDVVAEIWYPIWDAKYRLDYAVRTPREFGAIAGSDPAAGFAQLDLAFVAGDKQLVDSYPRPGLCLVASPAAEQLRRFRRPRHHPLAPLRHPGHDDPPGY